MKFEDYSFGRVCIDGTAYEHDLILDRGKISKRRKRLSKEFREQFGHTPLSLNEDIPWKCRRLVIGTGAHGSLPVMKEVRHEAAKRHVDLVVQPTPEAIDFLNGKPDDTNAILHLTC